MTSDRTPFARARAWTLCVAGVLAAGAALAAPDGARQRYEQERARCLNGQSHQDQATCLREAASAYAEARAGRLGNGPQAQYQRNAQARCERLPADDRADCLQRMQGHGTISGSVEGGGIYRETVTVTIGDAPGTTSASGTSAAPGQDAAATSGQGTSSTATGATTTPPAPATTTGVAPQSATNGGTPGTLPATPPQQPSR